MGAIRILATTSNAKGDLFSRLMADLFVALGYWPPELNLSKSGREIDLSAVHRLEERRAIAECKATVEPSGGAELNKFIGVLDAEITKKKSTTGYFISLSGFTSTAVEQEQARKRTRIVLLSGKDVVRELISGRIIVSVERALELAGRCVGHRPEVQLDGMPELLAEERGWIWLVYYSTRKSRSGFVLLHADGTPLSEKLIRRLVSLDLSAGGELHALECLNPISPTGVDIAPEKREAILGAYRRYLAEECGFIRLDGLPADNEIGSRRLNLESIIVPIHLDLSKRNVKRCSVGKILSEHKCVAILAPPGGGKSTLIKRVALAYSQPERRMLVADDLPDCGWFPVFFRCRELRGLARASFAELLDELCRKEPIRQFGDGLKLLIDQAMLSGKVLILIDGLDEISEVGDRAAFVGTIRSALLAHEGTGLIVTSREAGFRHVAAHLAAVCELATLSPFDASDIRQLSVLWHREVVGGSESVRVEAELLASSICSNDRIHRLAINPLLLTTLFLVKRWVGSLPTRRAALYGKAVEVLLMTWNTEGHDPIPEEEALPQLCFVASAMMMAETEQISRKKLSALIAESRICLPAELGYINTSVDEFINRVEYRSSLLMMSGHDIEDGQLVEFFEFRHLTFQEFLAARGIVEGWHPQRNEGDTFESALQPFVAREKWREVVPLAASLAGKSAEGLIRYLTQEFTGVQRTLRASARQSAQFGALARCLIDEAMARPETIRSAIRVLIEVGVGDIHELVTALARGRYGVELLAEAERIYLETEGFVEVCATLRAVVYSRSAELAGGGSPSKLLDYFVQILSREGRSDRLSGALGISELLRKHSSIFVDARSKMERVARCCVLQLGMPDDRLHYAIGQVLFLLGKRRLWLPIATPDSLGLIFKIWRGSGSVPVRELYCSVLAAQPVMSRELGFLQSIDGRKIGALRRRFEDPMDKEEDIATLVVFWYRRTVSDSRIRARCESWFETGGAAHHATLKQLLSRL